MISYYGSKSKLVNLYHPPKYDTIIEPFAGSARYSLKYWDRNIILIDKYEPIVKMWKYLQRCTSDDLDKLIGLNLKEGDNIHNFDLSEDEIIFLSFLVNSACTGMRKTVTKRSAGSINRNIQSTKDILPKIKHWDIRLGSYQDVQNVEATWFIDPPYFKGGEHYPMSNKKIDFDELALWCKERLGQVIVCENDSASWLPFIPLKKHWGGIRHTMEVVYYQGNKFF